MKPDSTQWCPMTGQEAMGINLNQEIPLKLKEVFSTLRSIKHWLRLPREVVASPSLEILKSPADKPCISCPCWPCSEQGDKTKWSPKTSSSPSDSVLGGDRMPLSIPEHILTGLHVRVCSLDMDLLLLWLWVLWAVIWIPAMTVTKTVLSNDFTASVLYSVVFSSYPSICLWSFFHLLLPSSFTWPRCARRHLGSINRKANYNISQFRSDIEVHALARGESERSQQEKWGIVSSGIIEWLGLERTLTIIWFQPLYCSQGCYPLHQVAQGLEHLQEWGTHSFYVQHWSCQSRSNRLQQQQLWEGRS